MKRKVIFFPYLILLGIAFWLIPGRAVKNVHDLLIPILAAAGYLYRLRYPYLHTATIPILMSVLSILLLAFAYQIGNDAWSILLSVVSLGLASYAIEKSFANSSLVLS
jgi:hypothetical protein